MLVRSDWGAGKESSSNQPSVVKPTLLLPFVFLLFRKSVPEPESLVASARDDRFPVRAHSKVEHSIGVAR